VNANGEHGGSLACSKNPGWLSAWRRVRATLPGPERNAIRTYVRGMASEGPLVPVEGSFDAKDSDQLQLMVGALEAGEHVTLDFHEVRSASDAPIPRLASHLRGAPRRVKFVGLSGYHYRVWSMRADCRARGWGLKAHEMFSGPIQIAVEEQRGPSVRKRACQSGGYPEYPIYP